jgi:molecular chaperone GrpE
MPVEKTSNEASAPETGAEGAPDAAADDAAVASAEAGRDETPSEVERLRAELAEARERADRYHSNWQRSAADFQNWKRRADQEKAELTRSAEAALTADLLRVLDDFERAFQSLPPELRSLTWVEGVALIWQKLFAILQGRGLSPIEALGRDFDPYLHEAVMREEEGDPSEQTHVVAEFQRGYRFGERVIRATLVKVGKPPAAGDQPSGDEGDVPTAEAQPPSGADS